MLANVGAHLGDHLAPLTLRRAGVTKEDVQILAAVDPAPISGGPNDAGDSSVRYATGV